MNILKYSLRNGVNYSMKWSSYPMYYQAYQGIQNKHLLISNNESSTQLLMSNRCFMKKVGLKPMYDLYSKTASKDNVSPLEYELVYIGSSELYVRCLSGAIIAAMIFVPSIFGFSFLYLWFTEEQLDLKTYLEVMALPHSIVEISIILTALVLMKIASYSFISKYVLRIYRHHTKTHHIGVYINPILPWKNILCTFETAIKLPDSKISVIPWHKEYYNISGYKSIILRERFRRPVDYDKMLGMN